MGCTRLTFCPHGRVVGWGCGQCGRYLSRQIAIRVSDELYARLEVDAEANGRTVAQSVRHYCRQALMPGEGTTTT